MRTIIIAALVLTLISGVSAVDKDVWAFSGDPIEFQGETYYPFLDNTRTSVYLESNHTTTILRLNSCRIVNFVRYCFVEVANDSNANWFTFDTNNQPLYGARYTFESLGPDVRLTQTYSTTNPDLNSRVEASVSVRNHGNQDANDVTVTYTLPPGARIASCTECDASTHSFTKRFLRIRPGETETITFSFDVVHGEPFSANTSATYSYGGVDGSAAGLTRAFTIKKPYDVSLTRPNAAPVGEWIPLRLTIRNTGDNTITADVANHRNASVTYENLPDDFVRELEPGETATYDYRVRSTRAGTYRTGHDVTIRRGSDVFDEELRADPVWRLQDVRLSAELSRKNPLSGDSNRLFVSIENTGTLTFRNLDITVAGAVEDERRITSISSGQRSDVFDRSFTHDHVDSTTKGELTVTLRYDTQFGEEQVTSIIVPYTVRSLNESYKLRRVIQPQSPAIGEPFTVTVYGEKLTESSIQLSEVADQIIGGRIERGNNRAVPSVASSEARLYQYEGVRENERFALITRMTVSAQNDQVPISDTYATFDLSEDQIEAIESGEEIIDEETLEDISTDEPADEPESDEPLPDREEPGFFARIATWFRNLFG